MLSQRSYVFKCFYMLLHAFACFYMPLHALYAVLAKVSEVDRWSHVYRLLPAEADKNLANYPTSGQL